MMVDTERDAYYYQKKKTADDDDDDEDEAFEDALDIARRTRRE